MSAAETLRIKIESLAETVGLENAAAALEKMANEAEDAGASTGKATMGMRDMNAVSSMTSGNIMGMTRGVAQLSKSLQGLEAAVPYIFAITSAFLALKKMIEEVETSQKEYEKMLLGIQTDNAKAAIDNLKTAYDNLKNSMSDASSKAQELLGIEEGLNEALRKGALQKEDLALAESLRNTADPLERQRLQAESAQRKAGIDASFNANAEALQQKAIEMEIEAAQAQIAAAEEMKASAANMVARNNQGYGEVMSDSMRGSTRLSDLWNPKMMFSRDARVERSIEEKQYALDQYSSNVQSGGESYKKAVADEQAGQHRLQVAQEKMRVLDINKSTSGVAAQTAATTTATAVEDSNRAIAEKAKKDADDAKRESLTKQIADLAKRESDAKKQLHDAERAAADRNKANQRDIQVNTQAVNDSRGNPRAQAEAQRVLDQSVEKAQREAEESVKGIGVITDVLKGFVEEMNVLRKELDDIKTKNRNNAQGG